MIIEKEQVSSKSAVVAALLCFLYGIFGLHRFYVGKLVSGFIYLSVGAGIIISILISGITWLPIILVVGMAIALIYDLYAMYSELFLDKSGKVLLSGTRQDELVGRTFQEKFLCSCSILMMIMMYLAFWLLNFTVFSRV